MIKSLIIICLITFSLQIEHCVDSKKVCKTCAQNYELVELNDNFDAKCLNSAKLKALNNIIENCVYGDIETKTCQECRRYYFLDIDQKKCIYSPHCNYFSDNECTQCEQPYALNNGNCVENLYCEKIENEKCIKCRTYYYPNENGECVRIPKNHCIVWDFTKCTVCENYYYPNENGECEKINLPNCEYVDPDDPTECMDCEKNYFINEDGECQKITIENCALYESENKCLICENSYQVNKEGKCELNPEHCLQFDDENKCVYCINNYYLDNEECKKIKIENCTYLDWSDSNKCGHCDFGYELSEDGTQCINTCQEIDEICYECTYNYYPFENGKSCHIIDPMLSYD